MSGQLSVLTTLQCVYVLTICTLLLYLSASGQIWGNLISSLVLSDRPENATLDVSPESLALCGPNDCPERPDTNNTNLEKPNINQVVLVATNNQIQIPI